MSGFVIIFCFFFKVNSGGCLHNRVATLVTIGEQKISPESDFFKYFFQLRLPKIKLLPTTQAW